MSKDSHICLYRANACDNAMFADAAKWIVTTQNFLAVSIAYPSHVDSHYPHKCDCKKARVTTGYMLHNM